jgi:hypothetical protein
LWIAALAAALSVLSTASWRAALEKTRLRDVLGRRNVTIALYASLIVFAAGVLLSILLTS